MLAAEDADKTLTQRAYDAGKGFYTVREKYRSRRQDIKAEGKKLKDEKMTWSGWIKKEKLSKGSIKRYLDVYRRIEEDPSLLDKPLTQIADLGIRDADSIDEPIEVGAERWVRGRQNVGTNWYVNEGDKIALIDVPINGRHTWMVETGPHRGKTFEMAPWMLSEKPVPVPKPERDKKDTVDRRYTARTLKGSAAPAPVPSTKVALAPTPKPPLKVTVEKEDPILPSVVPS